MRLSFQRRARHAGGPGGFTLVELLIVVVLVAILSSIGVGGYLALRTKAQTAGAEINVRTALPVVELYSAHHEGYTGMTLTELEQLEPGIKLSEEPVVSSDGRRFCIESTHNGRATTAPTDPGHTPYSVTGPGGDITPGTCPSSL
jgi:prepilin-type N-terminal cleavage/methylation domain-containing protein